MIPQLLLILHNDSNGNDNNNTSNTFDKKTNKQQY